MKKINKHCDYVAIANIFKSEKVSIIIAFKGEKSPKNLYLINEFPYDPEDQYNFKRIFSIFSSKSKPKEFVDFFVDGDKFYAVFKYIESQGINQRNKSSLSTAAFEDRCKILEIILIKLDALMRLPYELRGCVSEIENIKVDDNRNVYMTYDLRNFNKYRGADNKALFENIHDIILTLLPTECAAGFNKQLHIVLNKCKNGVYASIPELIIELKKAEKISKSTNWISYIKYKLSLHKPLLQKLSKLATVSAIAIGIVYFAYTKINEGTKPSPAATAVSIGNITYNGNTQDESQKTVSTESQKSDTPEKADADIILSEGLDIEYEDYVVKYGDTVTSICESYYKDSKYITAISTFNGIEVNTKLTPGSILKLPNRTAIALYLYK